MTLWSRGFARSRDTISLLSKRLWPLNLVRWWLTSRGSYSKNYSTVCSRGLARSPDKLKALYLYYHYVYGHQSCQDGNLPRGTPTHKVTWLFEHVVCKTMWQIKTIIYPLPSCPCPSNLAGWWLTMRGSHPQSFPCENHRECCKKFASRSWPVLFTQTYFFLIRRLSSSAGK